MMPVGRSLVPFGVGILLGMREADDADAGRRRGGTLGRLDIVELRGRSALLRCGEDNLRAVDGTGLRGIVGARAVGIATSVDGPRRRLKAFVNWVKDDRRRAWDRSSFER